MDNEPAIEPFADNQIAAAVDGPADGELLGRLKDVAGRDSVEVHPPGRGPEALAPSGFLERVRMAVSEDGRAIDDLRAAAEEGETIVVVDGVEDDAAADRITNLLIDGGAGWIFRFGELSWTELHSPASRSAASGD